MLGESLNWDDDRDSRSWIEGDELIDCYETGCDVVERRFPPQ